MESTFGAVTTHSPVSGIQHSIQGVEVDPCAQVHSRPKVNDLNLAIGRDEDVLRLDIPMHNAQSVHPLGGFQRLLHQRLDDQQLLLLLAQLLLRFAQHKLCQAQGEGTNCALQVNKKPSHFPTCHALSL